jgi:aryl-alcohol dehydrogenase-like predicted oxidoreductase
MVADIAQANGATPAQIALAWLLAQAPNVLLIPGTSKRSHPSENLQAGTVAPRQLKYAVSPWRWCKSRRRSSSEGAHRHTVASAR